MRRPYFRIAFTTLLLLGQGLGVLHAAEFGADSHDHDDVPCSALLHEDLDTPIATRRGTWPAFGYGPANQAPILVQGDTVCAPIAQPPATGPPSI